MSRRVSRSTTGKGKRSTFTYYIPAPPGRKSGYRERELDKILTGILDSGFEIEKLETQAVGNDNGAGLFVLAILRSPNAKVRKLDENQDIQERFRLSDAPASPDIILEDEFGDDL